ncbi:MAG: ankyrin repeat domain-containing protein, partial [Cytophagales bacterium]
VALYMGYKIAHYICYSSAGFLQLKISQAIANDNLEQLAALLKNPVCNLNATFGEERTTYLMWACVNNEKDIVQILLEGGARVNARDESDRTALDYVLLLNEFDEENMWETVSLVRKYGGKTGDELRKLFTK